MSQERVLIVEDEENERTGLGELIASWGFRTETARDGMEAMERVVAWSPSIIVTDLKMPRMGGMELLERGQGPGTADGGHPSNSSRHDRQRRDRHEPRGVQLHSKAD